MYSDPSSDTTYLSLLHPRGGSYTARSAKGSAPVIAVSEADPLPSAHVTAATLTRAGCVERLTYRVRAAGEKVVLFAQEGTTRVILGTARAKGSLTLALPGVKGRGTIYALFLRAGAPTGEQKLNTFSLAALPGKRCTTRSHS